MESSPSTASPPAIDDEAMEERDIESEAPEPSSIVNISGSKESETIDQDHELKVVEITPKNPISRAGTRSYYRRGSVVLQHLKKKIESSRDEDGRSAKKDLELYEKLKTAYENDVISKNTMIGLSIFTMDESTTEDPFAVINLPIDIQVAFHKKLYALFGLQMALATFILCIFTYVPTFATYFKDTHEEKALPTLLSFVIMLVILGVLYLTKYRYPYNFISLLIFSFAQAYGLTAIGSFMKFPHTAIFVSGHILVIVALMYVFTSRVSYTPEGEPVVMKHMTAGIYAYFGTLALPIILVGLTQSLSPFVFGFSCVTTLILVVWFTFDASSLCKKMSPDEYMQGVIFFYTDMILFMMFMGFVLMAILGCDGEIGGCTGCGGCGGGELGGDVIPTGDAGAAAVSADSAASGAYAVSRADAVLVHSGGVTNDPSNEV